MSATRNDVLAAQAVLDLASRADGFDVLELLHDLTTHVVDLLGMSSAGVTVLDGHGRVDYATASDETSRQLEEDQLELGEGPCVDSTRTGDVLSPALLRADCPSHQLWPRFTARAVAAGISCVAAVPLRTPRHPLGALNLLSADRVPTREDLCLAQVLADAAGVCLHSRRTVIAKNEIINQLEVALESRIVIEQAKGALAARLGVGVDEAFNRLRGHARAHQQKLTELATQIAQGSVPGGLDAVV